MAVLLIRDDLATHSGHNERRLSSGLTHKRLCQLAQAWLERPHGKQGPGCQFAFSETAELGAKEIPDAIGFRYDGSVLVECKVTRSDLLAGQREVIPEGYA